MKKIIVPGMLALTLAGAGLAIAQPAQRPDAPRWRPNVEDRAAFIDARIAALKAGLKLTAEQEKNWPAVEAAIRDFAKQRTDRVKERADRRAERREARRSGDNAQPRPDAIARLRRGADALGTRAAAMKKLADAAEPLYKTLDDGQKRRFGMLLRMGARPAGGPGRWHWQRRADNADHRR